MGAVGAGVTALCCFTPVLPILLGALGAGALIPVVYNDLLLLPLLAGFLILIGYALLRGRR
ncbi:mercury resistance system transport protein MerF [Jannaschia sp. M317]|nr:mercury resistance system transport protein MerF [Jannaschia sp. M317]